VSTAIAIDNVSKKYRLYHERNQALKAAIMRRRRARYEEFWALRDVTFDIEAGSTVGLIGENGSGKSTLLKCIANILRPDGGSINVDGKLSALLELGAGFHPELSGRENVYLNGAILGLSRKQIESRFDEIVDFAGLAHFVDSPVKNYSSGMYVRLGFSVAINVDPDILLFDEILAVGDAEFQEKCTRKFAELRAAGKTIVIVSHAVDSIRSFCDQAVLLDHGRIQSIGPADQVVDEYMDGVHLINHPDDAAATGKIRLGRIFMLDEEGKPITRTGTGASVTFRLEFEADEPVERPVFGLAVARVGESIISGPNSDQGGVRPEKVEGRGHVDYHVPCLPLLPGAYEVSIAVGRVGRRTPYDSRTAAMRFVIESGEEPGEPFGTVTFQGSWKIVDNEPPS
jgi:ABC-2 type transport system ATP-binding protein